MDTGGTGASNPLLTLILEAPSSGDTNPDPLFLCVCLCVCVSVCHANPYLKIASPGKNGLHKGQTLELRSQLRGLPRKMPPGKGGSPGKQSAAHIITGARAAAGAGASARSARAALGEGGAS